MSYKIEGLGKQDRRDLHINLREDELAILDSICRDNDCSRAAALGAVIMFFDERVSRGENITLNMDYDLTPGRNRRRPGKVARKAKT